MKSISIMALMLMIGAAGIVAAEEPAKAPEPLIKMSAGSAKLLGEPMAKEFPAMTAATVFEKASAYAPDSGFTMDEAGISAAYEAMFSGGFTKLFKWAHETGTFPSGPSFGMFYEDPGTTEPAKLTAKLGFVVSDSAKGNDVVTVERIPAMTAATLSFQGSYETSNNAWEAVTKWMEANGYDWAGPGMEIYLKGAMDVADPKEYVTEIRIPVKKREVKPVEGGTPEK